MPVNFIQFGAIVLIVLINRLLDQRFGRRGARLNNIFKGSGVPVKTRFRPCCSCIYLIVLTTVLH